MGRILSLGDSGEAAFQTFRTFAEGEPDLIPTGIAPVDRVVGGLFPGSGGILAAATGVGKSSLVLAAALSSPTMTGIVSLEDTEDVVGTRALAYHSGVDSLRIRKKQITDEERDALADARDKLEEAPVRVAFEVGSGLDEIIESIEGLADLGCRLIWVDYIQKIRGVREDRRNEVSTAFTQIQRKCDRLGVAAMFVSQFSRQPDPTRIPQIFWLKESGDLENEGRLIILCHKDDEEDDGNVVRGRIAKSTFGGEDTWFKYRRDESGSLREAL